MLAPAAAVVAFVALVALPVAEQAQAAGAGEVTHVSGALMARKADGQSRILSVKSEIAEGDVIATAENSYARVKFSDGTDVVMRPVTQLKVDSFKYQEQRPESDNVVFSLLKGGMRAVTGLLGKRNPSSFRVGTPSATIGIRGTTFNALVVPEEPSATPAPRSGAREPILVASARLVDVELDLGSVEDPKDAYELLAAQVEPGFRPAGAAPEAGLKPGLHIQVIDGLINVTNKGGSQNFAAGQFGFTPNFNQPPIVVPPNPGVQFTPPPAFSAPPLQGGAMGVGKSGGLECTI